MHMTASRSDESARRWGDGSLAAAGLFLRDLVLARHPLRLWLINVAAFALLAGWIVWDARFPATWQQLEYEVGLVEDASELDEFPRGLYAQGRIVALGSMVAVAAGSLAWIGGGLTFGSRGHRGLASWMVALSLGCLWLGLLAGWENLVWTGKQLRIDAQVAAFEPIAQSLQEAWPLRDGEQEYLGPFMAYPGGRAKTLILLTTPPVAAQGSSFSSVERSDAGGLRFQLSGKERGVWLEWHPAGHEPQSFVGGLEEPHTLQRAVPLQGGWFLAQYTQPGLSS